MRGEWASSCVVLCCQLVLNHYKPQITSAEGAWLKLHCCCLSRVDGPALGGRTASLSLVLLGKRREGWERRYCLAALSQRWCYWDDKSSFIPIIPQGWLRGSQNYGAISFNSKLHFLSNSCVLHPLTQSVNHSDTAQRPVQITLLFSMCPYSKTVPKNFWEGHYEAMKSHLGDCTNPQIKAHGHVSCLHLYKACWYQPFQMGVGWEASFTNGH